MKTIDRFDLNDDETTVTVELSTVGPARIAVSTYNRELGDRVVLLLSPREAQRVGDALLAAHADVMGTL